MSDKLQADYRRKLLHALSHLEYSFDKASKMELHSNLGEEELETWESFTARFARVVDIFLTKYLKAAVLHDDPAFDGSLRDFCNRAEKMNLIDSVDPWIARRELRNITAHDYEEEDLLGFFERILRETPDVLAIRQTLDKGQT